MSKRRVYTTDLKAGTRTTLSEFESAVREHAAKGGKMPEEWSAIDAEYDRAKQALLRKLLRMEKTA